MALDRYKAFRKWFRQATEGRGGYRRSEDDLPGTKDAFYAALDLCVKEAREAGAAYITPEVQACANAYEEFAQKQALEDFADHLEGKD